jgi:hypothetical protein
MTSVSECDLGLGATHLDPYRVTAVSDILQDASAGTNRPDRLPDLVAIWSHAHRPFAPICARVAEPREARYCRR